MSDSAYDGLYGRPCPTQLPGGWYVRCALTLAHAGIETNAVSELPRVHMTQRLARTRLAARLGREAERRNDDDPDQSS